MGPTTSRSSSSSERIHCVGSRCRIPGDPNDGYFYVADAPLEVRREWQLSRHIDPQGPVLAGTNWWNATDTLGGSPQAVKAGVRAHESYGSQNGLGHQQMIRRAIGQVGSPDQCGNVRRRLERVSGTPAELGTNFAEVLITAEDYVDRALDPENPHSWVGGTWSATIAFLKVEGPDSTWVDGYANDHPSGTLQPTAPADCEVRYSIQP